MPQGSGAIEHPGIIVDVKGDRVTVKVESLSACASCHAQGACTSLDSTSKLVEIKTGQRSFHIGDAVVVVLREHQGVWAVLLAYGIPAALILGALAVIQVTTGNELLAAGVSFLVLIVYYAVLFLCRHRLKKQFLFDIRS